LNRNDRDYFDAAWRECRRPQYDQDGALFCLGLFFILLLLAEFPVFSAAWLLPPTGNAQELCARGLPAHVTLT
jgi:hypothetical protein